MKSGWKIFWIIVAVITALGVICGCVSLALGVTLADLSNGFPVRENTMIMEEETFDITEDHSEQYEFENITDLDISVGACQVIIQASDTDTVQVDASHLKYQALGLELYVADNNGTLFIQTTKNGNLWDVLSEKHKNGGVLKIYIPKDVVLSTANLEFGACELKMSGLNITQMNLSLGATDCEMEQMNLDDFHAEVGAGNLEYSGTISGNAEIECGAGEVDINLNGTEQEFNYELSVAMGEIEIEDREYGGLGVDEIIDNHAKKDMIINCGAGSVSVDFK